MTIKELRKQLKILIRNDKSHFKGARILVRFDLWLWRCTYLCLEFSSTGYYLTYIYRGENKGKWEVYFLERDIKSQIHFFSTEESATCYFWEWINKVKNI